MPQAVIHLSIACIAILAFAGLGSGFGAAISGRTESGTAAPTRHFTGEVAQTEAAAIVPHHLRPGALARLLENVSPEGALRGAVLAAPGGNPEYQFHWTRDAAITMREVAAELDREGLPGGAPLQRALDDYADFSWRSILTPTQGGNGEPKYTPHATAFNEKWGRPQNDGPAMRALVHLRLEQRALARGEVPGGFGSARLASLRSDLDYIVHNWREASYDVWEEELAAHFYTRTVQREALRRGSELASALGDAESAERYARVADELDEALGHHWDDEHGILRATLPGSRVGGIDYKWTGLDTTVLLARLHADVGPEGILDDRLLSTAWNLESSFRREYPINHGQDGAVWIGRYPEDRYTGQPFADHPGGGNPWLLTTAAFGELHYGVAHALGARNGVDLSTRNAPFFLAALGQAVPADGAEALALLKGELGHGDGVLSAESGAGRRLRRALIDRGDRFLELVHGAIDGEGRHTEQLHRETGVPLGAEQLTWNDASLLSAYRTREKATADIP
ncbi:MAG: hypothetical protein KC416_04635 [Myxococcales bacterium]|nr:hypothetical protein [Myxococcales bacterium]